ncbi:autotransporter domain-containing protein [Sphingomonas sp.]|uniref:autotransporter domain-containing protein n=1 Tax=Sphingomonas sp. TaxID=28214 RepID=UPI0025EF8080|nr:autotransporter domain-containing protein [Sphingomonas sp.]
MRGRQRLARSTAMAGVLIAMAGASPALAAPEGAASPIVPNAAVSRAGIVRYQPGILTRAGAWHALHAPTRDLTAFDALKKLTSIAVAPADDPVDPADPADPGTPAPADLTLVYGDVSQSADNVPAIDAAPTDGNITITADHVSTTGDYSLGISATTPAGNISITADSVRTSGPVSTGVSATTGSGDILIDLATLSVGNSTGVQASAGFGSGAGNVSIDVDTVTSQDAGLVALAGGSVTINAGSVTTDSRSAADSPVPATGIVALSQGDITIAAGTVETFGTASPGIYAHALPNSDPYFLGAKIGITADTVKTHGDQSNGVVARSDAYNGFAEVNLGTVSTEGDNSLGVGVSTSGDIGYFSGGYTINRINVDSVTTKGEESSGISVYSRFNWTKVDAGTINTSGLGSAGINVASYAAYLEIAADKITTTGLFSDGVHVENLYGATIVDAGDISVKGMGSAGVYVNQVYGGLHGSTSVHVDSVTTTGNGYSGYYGSKAAYGILVFSPDAHIEVDAGTVTTTGTFAGGIVAATGTRNVFVNAGKVATSGSYSPGIIAISRLGGVEVTTGEVSTKGLGAVAIEVHSYADTLITSNTLSTKGEYSAGVYATVVAGDAQVTVGTIATEGITSPGIYFYNRLGDTTLDLGTITTKGINSAAVDLFTLSGNIDLSVDHVRTDGNLAAGIEAVEAFGVLNLTAGTVETHGDNASGIDIETSRGVANITVDSVRTTGNRSTGIAGLSTNGAINVHAGTVITTGDFSNAIDPNGYAAVVTVESGHAEAHGKFSAAVRALSQDRAEVKSGFAYSKYDSAIMALGGTRGVGVTVTGATTSAGGSAITLGGPTVDLVIGAGAVVTGSEHSEYNGTFFPGSDGVFILGTTMNVQNAGTIRTTGSGWAIETSLVPSGKASDGATIVNTGQILNAIKLSDANDSFTNAGLFVSAKDSSFGEGDDLFVNTGIVRLARAGSTPAAVGFLGLETFRNSGGVIDLRNGAAGDVLTLSGAYAASGDARLALDVDPSGAADALVIGGIATGTTRIQLTGTGQAALLGAASSPLVRVGAGSAADAFVLDPAASLVGFVQYGLTYDAANRSYSLVSAAGAPVYRIAQASEAAQTLWLKSADAVSGHVASLRQQGKSSGIWAQLIGGIDKREGTASVALPGGGAAGVDIAYRQTSYGGQIGVDLGSVGRFAYGVTGGYLSSKLRQGSDRLKFDTANIGVYAGYGAGAFSAAFQAKYDRHWVGLTSPTLGYSADLHGSSVGAKLDLGYRLGTKALAIEPVASLAWTRTDLGDLAAFGQTVELDEASGLRGSAGVRVSHPFAIGGRQAGSVYLSGKVLHEFAGTDGATLVSGGTSAHVANLRTPTHGQLTGGVDVARLGGFSAFVEGSATFGSAYKGTGGRLGVRLGF